MGMHGVRAFAASELGLLQHRTQHALAETPRARRRALALVRVKPQPRDMLLRDTSLPRDHGNGELGVQLHRRRLRQPDLQGPRQRDLASSIPMATTFTPAIRSRRHLSILTARGRRRVGNVALIG
jgi:hypothetical protein